MACWVPDSRSDGVPASLGNLTLQSASNLSRDCSVDGDVRIPVLLLGGQVFGPRLLRCVIGRVGRDRIGYRLLPRATDGTHSCVARCRHGCCEAL